jgi:pilus assembly protein CpaC
MTSISASKKLGVAHRFAIALAAATILSSPATTASAQQQYSDQGGLNLSLGRGQIISLPSAMTDIFVADDKIADVQVRSNRQLFVFGKAPGETTIVATNGAGNVIFSQLVRVGRNIETIDQMLSLAMPDAQIAVTTMNGVTLLTGTVHQPDDAAEAERLVQAFIGDGQKLVSRLRTATPLQVNLQVRIAEVNRTLVKEISGNILTSDSDSAMGNGFMGGIFRGRTAGSITRGEDGSTSYAITTPSGTSSLAGAGRLFGLDLIASLDIGERSGMVATLAQPNLTAISGETADFLAGGEFPVPVPGNFAGTTIEYRKYGVSLAYTPTVLSNGRISLRVRPEVSELTTEGAIRFQGFDVPALTVRRAETTVELGSGESFMIAGLLNNRSVGAIDKIPGLGDIPLIGTLFKSDSFRRGETELVIVVTPYLVKPVNANAIKLPTDAFNAPSDVNRILGGHNSAGNTGGSRPMPRLENDVASVPAAPSQADAAPGFSFRK